MFLVLVECIGVFVVFFLYSQDNIYKWFCRCYSDLVEVYLVL